MKEVILSKKSTTGLYFGAFLLIKENKGLLVSTSFLFQGLAINSEEVIRVTELGTERDISRLTSLNKSMLEIKAVKR